MTCGLHLLLCVHYGAKMRAGYPEALVGLDLDWEEQKLGSPQIVQPDSMCRRISWKSFRAISVLKLCQKSALLEIKK